MANKDMKMWHKRILFMISLPTEDYNENKELISDCISRLLEKGVDIRESIRREDLACINNYDIVIVVTHFDKDNGMLVLKDETMLISDFVNCLPENYDGYLDLSFCYSEVVKSAIKKRCPNYNPQVSEEETRLKVRLVAYPFVIDRIYENVDKDYHDIYMEVLDMLGEAATRNPKNDEYDDDSLRLGQKKTSIFAPLEARRKSLVPINIFIHCDSEKNEVRIKAARGTEVHINSEDLGEVKDGDSLTLTLSFMQCDDVQFLHIEGPDSKRVNVTEDLLKEFFIVRIDKDFNSPNFGCYISVLKDDQNPPIKKYPIFIELKEVLPQTDAVTDTSGNVVNNEELVSQLMPIFFSDNERIEIFLSLIRNVRPNVVTDVVNDYVKNKWISNYGNSHKGVLWKILHDAGLYKPSKSNWNNMVK